MPAVQDLPGHRLVAVVQRRGVESHRAASRRNISVVGRHSPGGGAAGSFQARYRCPYAISRSWCSICIVLGSDVRVARRVGQEVLDYDGEQIAAREAAQHLRLMWNAGRGIAGVHEQRLDRRVVDIEQSLTEPRHLQGARGPRPQVVAPQRGPVQAVEAARVVVDAATRITPVAGDAGNACDGSDRHPAAAVTLDADADANPGGPRLGEPLAQLDDRVGRKPGDRRPRATAETRGCACETRPSRRCARR